MQRNDFRTSKRIYSIDFLRLTMRFVFHTGRNVPQKPMIVNVEGKEVYVRKDLFGC